MNPVQVLLCSMAMVILPLVSFAVDSDTRANLYVDFESTNADCNVVFNFSRGSKPPACFTEQDFSLTSELAHSGEKALMAKVSVSSEPLTYAIFSSTKRIKLNRSTHFSGWLITKGVPVEAKVGIGAHLSFPQANREVSNTATEIFAPSVRTDWTLVEGEIFDKALEKLAGTSYSGEGTTVAWAVFLKGNPALSGKKLEFYIDDVRIEESDLWLKRLISEYKESALKKPNVKADEIERRMAEFESRIDALAEREKNEKTSMSILKAWEELGKEVKVATAH